MVDLYIMNLAHSIELYPNYHGAMEKEEEGKLYFMAQFFEEYR